MTYLAKKLTENRATLFNSDRESSKYYRGIN